MLGYKMETKFCFVFTDERNRIFYISEEGHGFLLEEKKIYLENRILCLDTLNISTFLTPSVIFTQQHPL